MESILWLQGTSPTESSTFVINGTINRDKYSENNQNAYDKLINMSELPVLHPKITDFCIKKGLFLHIKQKLHIKREMASFSNLSIKV